MHIWLMNKLHGFGAGSVYTGLWISFRVGKIVVYMNCRYVFVVGGCINAGGINQNAVVQELMNHVYERGKRFENILQDWMEVRD